MKNNVFEVERHPDGVIVLRFKAPVLTELLSEPTRKHMMAAQKEVFLTVRSMLDTAMEGAEEIERKTTGKKRTKIKVQ